MQLIAHRGLVTDNLKENTIEAFKAAINSDKYIGFELDVRVTKDKKLVVYHDLLYKGVLVRNVYYKDMKNNNVPLLEEVLKLNTNKIIMIEIKDFNMDLDPFIKLLSKYADKNLRVISFYNKVLKEIKQKYQNIKVGPLNYVLNSEEEYTDYDFICILNYVLTDNLIVYFNDLNIKIFVYGIKNKKQLKNRNLMYIVDDKMV